MSLYMNQTGPGEHNMPWLTGKKQVSSKMKNEPTFSMRAKVKMPYYPGADTQFKGSASPDPTRYAHQRDAPFKTQKYSVAKDNRFR